MSTTETARGMHDILPQEMAVRQHLLAKLRTIYQSFGFLEIETPALERIENLTNGAGGENEKLVFKVLKRGEKLQKALAGVGDLADAGLRYDLTLPLSRFYAAHLDELPRPFKALQIGNVWRADRPAKGRFRQFMQCDIDILGDATLGAEIELLHATTAFLDAACAGDLTVHLNDRRILRALVELCGFDQAKEAQILIALDKYDKIGLAGVESELAELGQDAAAIARYSGYFEEFVSGDNDERLNWCAERLAGKLDSPVIDELGEAISALQTLSGGRAVPLLDLSLVRGMGYYTGMIFEITSSAFAGSSIAGGGRYDKMVGQFTGKDTPACGFSIGFERLVTLLLEQEQLSLSCRHAWLYDKSLPLAQIVQLEQRADLLRRDGQSVALLPLAKNHSYQRKQLSGFGYTDFEEFH
ncbi:MAG: histidine--tRNA ligase [Coriobacteriales bacterium]|jgi:histidyl-tRNA synthetase|nr:histidine--tRNA ligase [Coriobacteriales bacterium]